MKTLFVKTEQMYDKRNIKKIESILTSKLNHEYNVIVVPEYFSFEVLTNDEIVSLIQTCKITVEELEKLIK